MEIKSGAWVNIDGDGAFGVTGQESFCCSVGSGEV